MKTVRTVLSTVMMLSFTTACAPGFTSLKTGAAPATAEFTKAMTAQTWCNVADNNEPFSSTTALSHTFQPNGEVISRTVTRSTDPTAPAQETNGKGTWSIDKGVMSLRDGENGRVLTFRAELIEVEPVVPEDVIWKAGITTGKQKCLKTTSLESPDKTALTCPCDFEKIVGQANLKTN